MINMIKELTRPLLIPMLARCVMTKGKGHLSMAIPFVNNLITSQGTSYNLRKSYSAFEKGKILGNLFEQIGQFFVGSA